MTIECAAARGKELLAGLTLLVVFHSGGVIVPLTGLMPVARRVVRVLPSRRS
jgi:hypothetical protein